MVIWNHETNPSHYVTLPIESTVLDRSLNWTSVFHRQPCFNLTIVLFLFTPRSSSPCTTRNQISSVGYTGFWMRTRSFRGRGWRGISRFVTTILVCGGNDRGWSMDRPCGRSEKIEGFVPTRAATIDGIDLSVSSCAPADRKNSNSRILRGKWGKNVLVQWRRDRSK